MTEPLAPLSAVEADAFDPEPLPPESPADGECCDSGCEVCVHDHHAAALAAYRLAWAAWRARQG